jgi:hypothetical protein
MNDQALISLITSGSASCRITDDNETISWSMVKLRSRIMPFNFYQCNMAGFGQISSGFSASFNETDAAKKSFCEAWERLCQQHFFTGVCSDGFAAGSTVEDAFIRSRNEKIERSVMLTCWQEQKGWQKIKFTSKRVRALGLVYGILGWKIELFRLQSNVGNVLACIFRHDENGAIFDSSFEGERNQTEENIFLSNLRSIYSSSDRAYDGFSEHASPSDHRQFYRSPKNLNAFHFLDGNLDSNNQVVLQGADELNTKVVVAESNFPAVCYTTHPWWPKLSWGMQSIKGKNPWPHPLA